jgi:hypothetical protein
VTAKQRVNFELPTETISEQAVPPAHVNALQSSALHWEELQWHCSWESRSRSQTGPLEKLSESNSKRTAFFPRDGSLKLVNENDRVVISEIGRSGMSIGALPGVRFKVIKVAGFSLHGCGGKKEKLARESLDRLNVYHC